MLKEYIQSIPQKPWYPAAKENVLSAWHTFAAAFLLAAIVQYKSADVPHIFISGDAIIAFALAAVRVCVKAGLQALYGMFSMWIEKKQV